MTSRAFKPELKDLKLHRAAEKLSDDVYGASTGLRGPGALEVAEQMRQAADSIAANIAEGFGRGVSPDGLRFMRIARGSGHELLTHVAACTRRGRMDPVVGEKLMSQTRWVLFLLERYMAWMEGEIRKAKDSVTAARNSRR